MNPQSDLILLKFNSLKNNWRILQASRSRQVHDINQENQSAATYGALVAYDYKNQIEKGLNSRHFAQTNFSDTFFFVPELDETIPHETLFNRVGNPVYHSTERIVFKPSTTKSGYIAAVNKLKEHIQQGDIYEVNYCIQFVAQNISIEPFEVFKKMFELTQAPHSTFIKKENQFLLCVSPERFLKKTGTKLVSEPMKGTIKRGQNPEEDEQLKSTLHQDPKERSENIMITDLVRNDLSIIAEKGTVKVEELCGVYTYPNLHQMISTVSAVVRNEVQFEEILRATFPMGSMTGAPKFRAMELIDQYEDFKRQWYSGTAGIIEENGDFDFNVIIRSLFYDAEKKYLSLAVGSAITALSDPEKEYEECLLKAESLLKAVNGHVGTGTQND